MILRQRIPRRHPPGAPDIGTIARRVAGGRPPGPPTLSAAAGGGAAVPPPPLPAQAQRRPHAAAAFTQTTARPLRSTCCAGDQTDRGDRHAPGRRTVQEAAARRDVRGPADRLPGGGHRAQRRRGGARLDARLDRPGPARGGVAPHARLLKGAFQKHRKAPPQPQPREKCGPFKISALPKGAFRDDCASSRENRSTVFARRSSPLAKPLRYATSIP